MPAPTVGQKDFAERRVKLIRHPHQLADDHYVDSNNVRKAYTPLHWRPELVNYNDEDWNVAVSDGGTIAQMDQLGGWLSIPTGGTDENETYVSTPGEPFLFDAIHETYARARISMNENTANKGQWIVGLSDTVAANSLLDAGAGPMASYDGAVFYKAEDGGISCESSNAGTQVTDADAKTWTDDDERLLEILYHPSDGTTGKVYFLVDGICLMVQDITISGLQEMHWLMGAKTTEGAANALEISDIEVIVRAARAHAA
tara:strand:+ start:1516 stop:2289 length:774 start_codon:yes stop_codon:yes gene_type:complete